MAKSAPRKTNRYSHEFKATAVRLSDLPDVLIQDVADALDIHPDAHVQPQAFNMFDFIPIVFLGVTLLHGTPANMYSHTPSRGV